MHFWTAHPQPPTISVCPAFGHLLRSQVWESPLTLLFRAPPFSDFMMTPLAPAPNGFSPPPWPDRGLVSPETWLSTSRPDAGAFPFPGTSLLNHAGGSRVDRPLLPRLRHSRSQSDRSTPRESCHFSAENAPSQSKHSGAWSGLRGRPGPPAPCPPPPPTPLRIGPSSWPR